MSKFTAKKVGPVADTENCCLSLRESEGSKFWLSLLTDLQQKGVKDILITCIDNLGAFAEPIASIYPKTAVQSCIVHQVRNALKYVAGKDSKAGMADVKLIYEAADKEMAKDQLDAFKKKSGAKYPIVTKSWRNNWHKLSRFFKYAADICRVIDTNNTIE